MFQMPWWFKAQQWWYQVVVRVQKIFDKSKAHFIDPRWHWPWKLSLVGIFGAILIIDLVVKHFVAKNFALGDTKSLMPGFIDFWYVTNNGIAFGLGQGQIGWIYVISFIISLATFLGAAFVWNISLGLGFTFIAGGGFSNIIDRFMHNGKVIDFLWWRLFKPSIFNVADFFVVVGVVIIVITLIVGLFIESKREYEQRRKEMHKDDKEASKPSSPSSTNGANHHDL